MLQKRWVIRFVCLVVAILSAAVIFPFLSIGGDPPHNEASGISCSDCHGQTLLNSQSPFYTENCSDTAYNSVCLSVCHNNETVGYDTGNVYNSTTAPMIQSHAPGGTVIKCITCHHNHDQDQIYAGKNEKDKFFLAMGTLAVDATTPIAYDSGTNRTAITYDTLLANNDWDLPLLAKKTGDGRGAMLVPNYKSRKRWPVYIIKSIDTDAKTITVKGNVSSASDLGIFYGQLIRRTINYEPDPEDPFAFMPANVKLYERMGNYGLINDSATGMCQICHISPDVSHWTNDGNGRDHNQDTNCMVCHGHSGGFLHGGGGTDCSNCHVTDDDHDRRLISVSCDSCHAADDQIAVDSLHTDCATCHGYGGIKLDKTQVARVISNGRGANGLDQTCENCHSSGHDTELAHNKRILTGMVPDCSTCHVIGDQYAVDSLHTDCSTCHAYQGALSAGLIALVINTGMAGTEQDCQDCHTIDHAAFSTDTAHDRRDLSTGSFRFDCSSSGCHIVTDHTSLDSLHTKCDTCHYYTGTKIDRTLVDQVISDGKGVGGPDPNCESCHTWEPHHDMARPNRISCESCHLGNVVVEHVDQRTYDCDTCHASGVQAVIDTIADGKNDIKVTCDSCHNDSTVNPAGTYQAVHHATLKSQSGDCLYCHGVGRGVNGQKQASCSKCHSQGKWLDPQRPSTNGHDQGPAITNVQDYRACFSCHLRDNRGYDPDPDGLPIGDPGYSGTPVVFPYHAKPDLSTNPGRYIGYIDSEEDAQAVPGLGTFNFFTRERRSRWGSLPPAFPMYWTAVKYSGEIFSIPSLDGTGKGGQYPGAGNLTVTIEPPALIAEGAEWSVDGWDWLASGSELNGLAPRQYLVETKKVLDWASPPVQPVDITDGSSENITITYVSCPADPSITISGTSGDGDTITWDSPTHTETFQVQAGDFRYGDIQWVLTTGGAAGFTAVPTGPESVSVKKIGGTFEASYSFTLQAIGSNCPGNEATISFAVDVTVNGLSSPPNEPSTGKIGYSIIDSYAYKLDLGQAAGPESDARPEIFHVRGNIYGVVHEEPFDHYPSEIYLQTLEILPSGEISHIDTFNFAGSGYTYAPAALKVSDGVFAIAYTYYGTPVIETISINSGGYIESIKRQGFSYPGDTYPNYQSQLQELGGGYYVVTNDKFMFTIQIDPTGETISEVDSRAADNFYCNLNNEGLVHIANDIYAYCDSTTLNTIAISATGDISNDPIDTLDTMGRQINWLRHVEGDVYLAAGSYAIDFGQKDTLRFLGSYEIRDNGQIAANQLGGFELDSAITQLLQIGPDVFAAVSSGSVKTYQVLADGVISLQAIGGIASGLGETGLPNLLQVGGDDPVQNDQVYVYASDGFSPNGLKTICIYDPETDDLDNDWFCDQADTCPDDPGIDADNDGLCGDADPCPGDATNDTVDNDTLCGGTGYDDTVMTKDGDNCPTVANGPAEFGIPNVGNQLDTDEDGVGDACDNCMGLANSDQVDIDCDGIGDACDADIGNVVVGPQCYYSAIQAAIDASTDGDTVMVRDGTYIENIDFKGKDITLHSENGPSTTIIDGGSKNIAVVSFRNYESQSCVLDGFTIQNGNTSGRGGGGIYINNTSPTITNCIIRNNSSTDSGGGIYVVDKYSSGDPVNISNTVIENNSANGSDGGGIYMYKTDVVLTDSIIRNNSAENGGGIHQGLGADLHVINSYVVDNSATVKGGGLDLLLPSSVEYEYLYLSNSTIAGNSAADGGGFYLDHQGYGYQFRMVNSIVWGNTDNSGPSSIAGNTGIAIYYSDIEGSGGSVPNSNIDMDPHFTGAGDYHLANTSPCIDSGTDDVSFLPQFPALPTSDIDGDSRPTCPNYDMGADEHPFLDDDGDGVCNSVDICLLGDDAVDADGDDVPDACDLCPGLDDSSNDLDGDGLNDTCDPCPGDNPDDIDGDGVCASVDPCPLDNPDDTDGDGLCDSTDPCPLDNPNGPDGDGDGIPDVCDLCITENPNDVDGDGLCASADICPEWPNADQADCDTDGIGDVCDPVSPCTTDRDGDGVVDGSDNCIMAVNPDQADTNFDGMGDACTLYHFVQKELAGSGGAAPQISDSRKVVWAAGNNIYLYEESTTTTTQITSNGASNITPVVNYDGDVVWEGKEGASYHIFLYDHVSKNTVKISQDPTNGWAFPQINSSGDVVWYGSDGSDDEIYLYDKSDALLTPITDNSIRDEMPRINNLGDVAWHGFDGTSEDIYYYKRTTGVTSQLSIFVNNENSPYINDSRDVVYRKDNADIVFYDASADDTLWLTDWDDGLGPRSSHGINAKSELVWTDDEGVHIYKTATDTDTIISSGAQYSKINDNSDVIWTTTTSPWKGNYYNAELDRTFVFFNGWTNSAQLNIRGDVAWASGGRIYLALFGIDPDSDADGISDSLDNCPATENSFQIDTDLDGIGDACDNCDAVPDQNQSDCDGDGLGDICDGDSPCSTDTDSDTIMDDVDNCISASNLDQADCDTDGVGDVCETHSDSDGIPDDCDNCDAIDNLDQNDLDLDGLGDACDPDDDEDGVPDGSDNCPFISNPGQEDTQEVLNGYSADGIGDACDNCPTGLVCFDLPDTGQDSCYDGSGSVIPCPAPMMPLSQDGTYLRNPPFYTDNFNNTITDNNTRLMWQQDDGGMMDPFSADTYCSSFSAGGYGDWRLPNRMELATLLDYEFEVTPVSPAIDLNYFPSTNADYYHTSDSNWRVNLGSGTVDGWGPGPGYARCVRGEEIVFGEFIDNGDSTVTDNSTGLMWQQINNCDSSMNWESALGYCETLIHGAGGFDDWRLPSVRELMTTIDVTTMGPALNLTYLQMCTGPMYWSSTTGLTDGVVPDPPRGNYAEIVDFSDGSIRSGPGSLKSDQGGFSVRCVRTEP